MGWGRGSPGCVPGTQPHGPTDGSLGARPLCQPELCSLPSLVCLPSLLPGTVPSQTHGQSLSLPHSQRRELLIPWDRAWPLSEPGRTQERGVRWPNPWCRSASQRAHPALRASGAWLSQPQLCPFLWGPGSWPRPALVLETCRPCALGQLGPQHLDTEADVTPSYRKGPAVGIGHGREGHASLLALHWGRSHTAAGRASPSLGPGPFPRHGLRPVCPSLV